MKIEIVGRFIEWNSLIILIKMLNFIGNNVYKSRDIIFSV